MLRSGSSDRIGRGSRPRNFAVALGISVLLTSAGGDAEADGTEAERDRFDDGIEEMLVVGEARPEMDVLAGATTTRIDVDNGLIEGAQIDDLLAEVPGVQVRRFGGVGERFEISIRGSTPEQVPVLLDGVRVDSSLTGRGDLSTICLDVLDEIQVTRGAGAARSGSGAIGGVVNLVSRPAPEKPESRVRLSAGNFESVEGSLRHARRVKDWSLSLAYCGFHTEGDFEYQRQRNDVAGGSSPIETRENNQADRHTTLVQVGRSIGRGSLRVSQLASYLDRGNPGLEVAPRLEAKEQNLSLLSSTAFEYPFWPKREGRFGATLAHRFEGNDFEDPEPVSGRPDPIDVETAVHTLSAQSSASFELEGLGATHAISFLAEGRFDRRESNEAKSKSRAGVALRAELSSAWLDERLVVSPSLRFERYSSLDGTWIPGLFVEGRPLEWMLLKGSVSRSYRIPTFQELYLPDKGFERGNEDLDPERAWNFELGTILESPFDVPWLDGEIEATWFAGEVDDSIAFTLISTNVVAPRNIGSSKIRGYELSLRWRPHPLVRLTAARTVTEAKRDVNDRNVVGIAVSQIDGRLELGPRERWKLVGEVHYTGRIPQNLGGTAELASRVMFDASASVDLARIPALRLTPVVKSLWLSFRGRNLGNVAVRDTVYRPRPGRNFSLALEGVF